MKKTWVEEQGLRRSKSDLDKLRRELAQMLAQRELEKDCELEECTSGRSQGFIDCLRGSLQAVERAELELKVYDLYFQKTEAAENNEVDTILGIVRETDEEKLEGCELELQRLIALKKQCKAWPDMLVQIAREVEKVKEVIRVLGHNVYEVELVEERCTTQMVLAETPQEARNKSLAKQGVVIDVDDSATAKREPRIRLEGRLITKSEMV